MRRLVIMLVVLGVIGAYATGGITVYNGVLANLYHNRGLAYQRAGDDAHAAAAYRQELRFNPRSSRAYNDLGLIRADGNDYRGAIALFDQALRIDPSYAHAYSNRGDARIHAGDYRGAVTDLTQATPRHDIGDVAVQCALARIDGLKGVL